HDEVHCRRCAPNTHGHDNDRGRDVVDVGTETLASAQRAAEDVDEQQERDGWSQQATHRHLEVAQGMPGIAPQHGGRIAQSKGKIGHRTLPFWVSGWLVRAKKTSSRLGVCTDTPSTVIAAWSSWSSTSLSEWALPSVGTWSVSSLSLRTTSPRVRAAASSLLAPANCRRICPPGMRRLSSSGVPPAINFP